MKTIPVSFPLKTASALLLALCAAPVLAQSSVTLYGVMDLGVVRESGGPAGSLTKLTSGMAGGSRLGFRGTEDLGGGLSAFFTLESGLFADTGAFGQGGLAFGRQSFVGLKGGFGAVSLGRQYTPAAMVQVEMDPFVTGLAGTSANLLSPGGAGGNNRMDNAIKYNTPGNLNGFNAEAVYGFGEVANNSAASRQYGANVGYAQGPLSVKAAYHNVNNAAGVGSSVTWLAGKYDFGVLTGYANYVINKGSAVFGVVNPDSRDTLLGVSVPLGSGKLMASYIRKRDQTSAGDNASQFAVGYDHFLSKRTDVYVSYAHINNSKAIVAGSSGYRVGNSTEQGSGNQGISVGIRHSF